MLQGTRYNHIDAETSDEDGHLSLNGKGYTASLEAGYPLQLSAHTVLEPEAQLIGSQTHMDNGTDQNSTVHFNHPWQYTGRLGARLVYTPGDSYALWAQASAWHTASTGTQKTTFNTFDDSSVTPLDASPNASWTQLGVGYSQRLGRAFSIDTGFSVLFPVAGGRGERAIASNVRLKYSF